MTRGGSRDDATHRHPSSQDATPSRGGIEFGTLSGLILERLESPGWAPGRAAARAPPSAGRGVAGFAAPRTLVQSAPQGAAARRTAGTPERRTQTSAASTRPIDTRPIETDRHGAPRCRRDPRCQPSGDARPRHP